MAETWTIAEAARRCGCPRSTLQRAVRAGRLHLDADHHLTVEELTQAGYLDAAAAQQSHAPVAQQSREQDPSDLTALMRSMQHTLERLTTILEVLCHEVQTLRLERSSRLPLTPGRKRQPRSMERPRVSPATLQPRSMEPDAETPPYDPTKYVLGRLCPRGHEYEATGKTLLRMPGFHCRQCENELARERRAAQREVWHTKQQP
jgi:hypothetical protein